MKKHLFSASLLRANSWVIYLALLVVSLGIAFVLPSIGLKGGIVVLALLFAVPIGIYSIVNIEFGIVIFIVFSFCFTLMSRFSGGFPLGVFIDVFLCILLIGLLLKKWKERDFSLAKSPLSYALWIWLIYNCLEVFNPLGSVEAWLYFMRSVAGRLIFFFIVLGALDNIVLFRRIVVLWIFLAFLSAAYGLFQEFHGLLKFDRDWVMADDTRFRLYFVGGRFRIFSVFNNPTVYGILMAVTGLFCVLLVNNSPLKFFYKILLSVAACAMFLATVFSGTRTAYAIIPVGFIFFALLTSQLRTIVFTGILLAFGAVIVFTDIGYSIIPRDSIERVRSAFKPKEDPSYLVREKNQAMIKPFIQSHAFGSGLGSIGIWGVRFTKKSALAEFDPDSGYVRAAVETGWVGLILYSGLLCTALIMGIRNFYQVRNLELKAYMAGLVSVVYAFVIGEFPQQGIIQLPNVFIFLFVIASIVKLKDIDIKLRTK